MLQDRKSPHHPASGVAGRRQPRTRCDVLRRRAAVLAAAVTVLIFLGCMSLSIGGRNYEGQPGGHTDGDVFIQKGTVHVKGRCEQDVYYPVPYAHTPNLELGEDIDQYHLVEQKEDHFRVWNPGPGTATVKWKARGVRVPPPAPVPPPVVVPEQAAPLPPEPVPVR
jgi:hypothetical protein